MPTSLPLVLLTDVIASNAMDKLSRHARLRVAQGTDGPALIAQARDADLIVVRHQLPDDIFEHTPRMRGAIRHGTGVDMIPVPQASQAGVMVVNVPGVNAQAVAEYAVGQMLNLSRLLIAADRGLRSGQWARIRSAAHIDGTDMAGKSVTIVGLGAIGKAVAHICRLGFGMRITGVRRDGATGETDGIPTLPLDEALATADYIIMACPLTDATRGLINARRLSALKPGARLVNIARNGVLDLPALCDALRAGGPLAGAALDVSAPGTLPADSPILAPDIQDRLALSPHLAGMSRESMEAMGMSIADQAIAMLRGEDPPHWFNRDAEAAVRARWARLGAMPAGPDA